MKRFMLLLAALVVLSSAAAFELTPSAESSLDGVEAPTVTKAAFASNDASPPVVLNFAAAVAEFAARFYGVSQASSRDSESREH